MIFPYLFITGLVLLLLLFILNRAGFVPLSIFKPVPTTVVLWLMILYWVTVITYGSVPGICDVLNTLPIEESGYEPSYPFRILFVTFLSGLGLLVGITFVSMATLGQGSIRAWKQWYSKPLIDSRQARLLESLFWPGLLVAILFCLLYVWEVGGIKRLPFMILLSGGSYLDIITSREESFKLLDSPLISVYSNLRLFFFPLWVSLAYLLARVWHKKRYWVRFGIVFGIGLSYSALSTALSPIGAIFLHLFFCEVLIQGGNTMRQLQAYVLGVGAIIGILFMFIGLYPDAELQIGTFVLKILNEEIFMKGFDTFNCVSAFTNVYPFQTEEFIGLRGIPRIANAFDLTGHNITNYLYLVLNPNTIVTSGMFNGPWFLYDYVIFSYPATFLGSLVLGLILGSLGEFFRRRPKDILLVICFVQSVASSRYIFDTTLSTWLISKGGIVGMLFYLLINILVAVKTDLFRKYKHQGVRNHGH